MHIMNRVRVLTRILGSGLLAWSLALASPAVASLNFAIDQFDVARTFAGGSSTDRLLTTAGLSPAHQFTLSLWLNATTLDATPRAMIWWDDAADTSAQFLVFSTATVTTLVALGGFSPSGVWTVTPPSTGTWHHFAITYDPSATANNPVVYLDGVSQTVTTTRTPVGTWAPTATPMIIGNGFLSVPWDMPWDGSLAGVALWDVVLSSADIAALAQHGDACALSVSRYAPRDPTWNVPGSDTHLRLYLPMGIPACCNGQTAVGFEEPYSFHGWTATVTGTTLTTWTGLAHTRYWGCMDAP